MSESHTCWNRRGTFLYTVHTTEVTVEVKRPELNIVVCTDDSQCAILSSEGRNPYVVLDGLRKAVRAQGLEDTVQVTHCRCIFGCTYGPRIDVSRRWSGEKVLYGTVEGEVTISVRGRVKMRRIPSELLDILTDNLSDEVPATSTD